MDGVLIDPLSLGDRAEVLLYKQEKPFNMSSKHTPQTNPHDWNASNVLDDVDFQEHEARQFRDLLYGKGKAGEENALSLLNAGQILKGRIVEITKDYVVIDVGLKSEGLVPISEFSEP